MKKKEVIERIKNHEDMFNGVSDNIKELESILSKFKENKENIKMLNKYYGSKEWFEDKESFENKEIIGVDAGVLSEDAIWNMNENIKEILLEMENIISEFHN